MSYDITLLSLMSDKKSFNRFSPYVKEYSVSKEVWELLKAIKEYYRTYPTKDVFTWSDMRMYFFMLHSKAKEDTYLLYTKMFDNIEAAASVVVDSVVLDDVLKHFIKMDYATQVFNKAHKIVTAGDEADLDEVEELVQSYRKEVGTAVRKADLFVSFKLSDVIHECASAGYNWRLNELNKSLGPIRHGDFIVLAARPETGKTTMVASEASFIAHQFTDDRPLIWVNNEERSVKVSLRIMQSYFGVDSDHLIANLATYEARWETEMGGRILVLDDEAGYNHINQLDAIFAELNPQMIVFDQLDKVKGFSKSEREDIRIGHLYEWGRNLSKKYGPVIAISQVDGTGEGQEWIYMNQLRGSKTDKIGEADAIVTIGKSNDPSKEYNRYIHVPKNKLFGGGSSDESFRHGYFEVRINPPIARYEGVL